MEKCILEHCEFAQGGQCCFVCPKDLGEKIARRNAADRIDAFVKILKKIKKGRKREKEDGLPIGVCVVNGTYKVYISHNKRQIWLGSAHDLDEALDMRADAEDARENGNFDVWLAHFREMKKTKRKKKAVAGNGRMESESN